MGRINPDSMDNYSSSTQSEWLKLSNDGDVARVQFLYNSYDELDTFAVHKVKLEGQQYDKMVDCKRDYDDPIDVCPLCAAGFKVEPVMILSMYDHSDGKIKIWQRGKNFRKVIESKFNRYPNLSNMVFEIERHGVKNDTGTTYELIPMPDVEPFDVSEIERPNFIGGVILDKTPDEMQTYLDTGSFPSTEQNNGGSRRNRTEQPSRYNEGRGVSRRVGR